jgi:hypothetical protein
MGREVRRVPANWQHPRDERTGRYIPLLDRDFASDDAEWTEGWQQWQRGLCKDCGEGEPWKPIPEDDRHLRYTDYSGPRPSPDDYMPPWPDEEKTHLMMYEDTSEGTPISPVMESAEELARWLADNGASSFGSMTATYEQWLATIKRGWACSAVVSNGARLRSGVEALADLDAPEREEVSRGE